MNIKYFTTLKIALFFSLVNITAQLERNNYEAFLEIEDVVIHGAGQSPDTFENYFNTMPTNNKPAIYMYYCRLKAIKSENWVSDLSVEMDKYPDHYLIPQIGLSMTSDGKADQHYEGEVAAGNMIIK